MMHTVLHWAMVAALVILGVFALSIYGELFRAHMLFFLFVWVFVPVVASWLSSAPVLSALSISSLKMTRALLVGIVISLSFISFADYDRIRDSVGERLVDGYVATYSDDTDDYGRPTRSADVSTSHWYSKLGLWVFEWIFLGACVLLPYATWRMASRAVDEAIRRNAAHDAAA